MCMRFVVGLLVCAGGVSLALADDPPAAPASAPAAPASAPAAPASAPAAPAASAPAAAAAPPTTAAAGPPRRAPLSRPPRPPLRRSPPLRQVDFLEKHFTQEGFKPEMRHGQEVYCRQGDTLGSRLTPVKTCGTIDGTQADGTAHQKRHGAVAAPADQLAWRPWPYGRPLTPPGSAGQAESAAWSDVLLRCWRGGSSFALTCSSISRATSLFASR